MKKKLCYLLLATGLSAQVMAADGAAQWRFSASDKVVAIGDVHGNMDITLRTLRLADAIDEDGDDWIGGEMVLVQTGDQMDRGCDDKAILDLFEKLAVQAKEAGGAFHVLNGNHEMMNAAGNFSYAVKKDECDLRDDEKFTSVEPSAGTDLRERYDAAIKDGKKNKNVDKHRIAALVAGGEYAKKFAKRNTVIIVGDNLFVHGGVTSSHYDYGLEKYNQDVQVWLHGAVGAINPEGLMDISPVWDRSYSKPKVGKEVQPDPDGLFCSELNTLLHKLKVKRMIVGHTPQAADINSVCDGLVWRIDTKMWRNTSDNSNKYPVSVLRLNKTELPQVVR